METKKRKDGVTKKVLTRDSLVMPKPIRSKRQNKADAEEMCEFQLHMKMPGHFQGVQADINRNTACDSVRQDVFNTMLVRGGNFFDNIEQFVSCHQKQPCAFKHFKKNLQVKYRWILQTW